MLEEEQEEYIFTIKNDDNDISTIATTTTSTTTTSTVTNENELGEGKIEENTSNTIHYVIRGLQEDEIGAWSEFCASVFAYKSNPPPPSYFERHYTNDPFRGKSSLIRVATVTTTTKDGEQQQQQQPKPKIVASCRLFLRTISCGSGSGVDGAADGRNTKQRQQIFNNDNNDNDDTSSTFVSFTAGGIGEVCTDMEHRKRGLSKMLLQNVINIMKERNVQVSLLHAAPEFFPVYQKAGGYVCSQSCWSVLSIDTTMLLETIMTMTTKQKQQQQLQQTHCDDDDNNNVMVYEYTTRSAKFPMDTEMLSLVHQNYSERRLAGCIIRTKEYWNEYLSKELGESLIVLTQSQTNSPTKKEEDNNNNNNNKERIIGWISLRSRGEDRMQLREFGLDENTITTRATTTTTTKSNNDTNIDAKFAFSMLLAAAIQQEQEQQEQQQQQGSIKEKFALVLPTFVLDQMKDNKDQMPFIDWSDISSQNDMGWMYKVIDDKIPSRLLPWLDGHGGGGDNDNVSSSGSNCLHLIWPSDSF